MFMRSLTPEQILGTRFEVWMEQVLKDNDYLGVRRNVHYYKSRYTSRQVDLEYRDLNALNPLVMFNSHVILELKYSTAGLVHLKLRHEKTKSEQLVRRIDTVIAEVEERREFVRARKAILTTNGWFSYELRREAQGYRHIELWSRDDLEELDRSRRGVLDCFFPKVSLDNLSAINLRKFNLGSIAEKV
mgnify:CR=1 FL=1